MSVQTSINTGTGVVTVTLRYIRVTILITRCTYALVFVLSNLAITCECITGVFQHLHEWVGGGWKWVLFQLVHGWRVLLAWGAVFWQG